MYVNWLGFELHMLNLAGAACDISEPTKGKTLHFATILSEIPEL